MEYFFSRLPEITRRLNQAAAAALLLDFDGTLSPIAATPGRATLPEATRNELKNISAVLPMAVISGRALRDIKNKVRVKNIIYAGNHGLEWSMGGKSGAAAAAKKAARPLAAAKRRLMILKRKYPGMLIEDKGLALAIHYRRLGARDAGPFKKALNEIFAPFAKGRLTITKGKKVMELRSNTDWNKGKFVLFLENYFTKKFRQKPLLVYIGDDVTDEDAFAALSDGIAIRVGRKQRSRARYYIKNQSQVPRLLAWFAHKLASQKNRHTNNFISPK